MRRQIGLIGLMMAVAHGFACDISAMRELQRREFEFAYHGGACGSAAPFVPDSDERIRYMIDHKADCYEWSTNLLRLCERIIRCDSVTADKERRGLFSDLGSCLMEFRNEANRNVSVRNGYWRWLRQVEYMIARIIERDEWPELEQRQIKGLLPDALFEFDSLAETDYMKRYWRFRNLLIVSCAIRTYKMKTGHLPSDITDLQLDWLEGLKNRKEKILYAQKGGNWQLVGCRTVYADKREFNIYVPSLGEDKYVWKGLDEVFLSGDFAMKRERLYRGEILNEGTPWRCKLSEGHLIKPLSGTL